MGCKKQEIVATDKRHPIRPVKTEQREIEHVQLPCHEKRAHIPPSGGNITATSGG